MADFQCSGLSELRWASQWGQGLPVLSTEGSVGVSILRAEDLVGATKREEGWEWVGGKGELGAAAWKPLILPSAPLPLRLIIIT